MQLSKYNTLLLFEETRQELHNPSCFDFSSEFDVLLFDFSPAEFFDCTYYLNDGTSDYNPRKIHMDSWVIILQNKSKYLLLNDRQIPHQKLFSLLDEIQDIKKMNTRELKERKLEKKVRELRWVVLIFIWLHLLFCLAP